MNNITVTTARQLAPTQKEELISKIEKKYGMDIAVNFVVDDALIGGMTIFDGKKVYDGSVYGQLKRLKEELKKD